MFMIDNFLWVEKYRPQTVAECILPTHLKTKFQTFVNQKVIPSLILSGPPGIGKTSVAIAMIKELKADYIKINAAKERGIDVVRDRMEQFASTVSLRGGRKYIILDEADGISPSALDALKGFIEEFSSHVSFIFTCNNQGKIIEAIQSRCELVEFKITKDDFPILGKEFYTVLRAILDKEEVIYDLKVLAQVIKRFYPDWRRILNKVQNYSISNNKKIDTGILVIKNLSILIDVVPLIRSKNWNEVRRW